jgi:pantetheine-phosphate adenylyltransferase
MSSAAVYPGTFDPITNGHIDLISRAIKLFDRVVIAVATGGGKTPLFDLNERLQLAKQVFANQPEIEVCILDGLLVDFAIEKNAHVIIRGLRTAADFDYEFQLAGMNRCLNADIETLFLTPSAQHAFVSSTLVREVARLKGDISQFVHPIVATALHQKLNY